MSDQTRNDSIIRVERIIKRYFNQPDFCWEAVQVAGSGVSRIGDRDTSSGNQNLAVLGDSALKTAMAKIWIHTGTSRGCWQNRISTVLSNANLAQVGFASELAYCLHKNPSNPVAVSDRLAATLVEAVCGAVYLDGGDAALAEVMEALKITLRPNERASGMINANESRDGFGVDPSRMLISGALSPARHFVRV